MPGNNGFDPVAGYYDQLVNLVFGKSMRRAQLNYLHKISKSSTILVLGGGTGNWLSELLRINSNCKITYIDQSARMIALARINSNNSDRIEFRIGTEDVITETNYFDAIIMYCYLDLFPDKILTEVVSKIRNSSRVGSRWLIVDFVSGPCWQILLLYVMYRFFRFTTGLSNQQLPDWKRILEQNKLTKTDEQFFYMDFISSSCWKLNN